MIQAAILGLEYLDKEGMQVSVPSTLLVTFLLSFILIGELRNSPQCWRNSKKLLPEFSSERQGASLPIHNLYHHIPTRPALQNRDQKMLGFTDSLTIPVC